MRKGLIAFVIVAIVLIGCKSENVILNETEDKDVDVMELSDHESELLNYEIMDEEKSEEDNGISEVKNEEIQTKYETLYEKLTSKDTKLINSEEVKAEIWEAYLSFIYEEMDIHLKKNYAFYDRIPINVQLLMAADKYREEEGLEYNDRSEFLMSEVFPYVNRAQFYYEEIQDWMIDDYYYGLSEINGEVIFTQQERAFSEYSNILDDYGLEIHEVKGYGNHFYVVVRKWSKDWTRYKNVTYTYKFNYEDEVYELTGVADSNGTVSFLEPTVITGYDETLEPNNRLKTEAIEEYDIAYKSKVEKWLGIYNGQIINMFGENDEVFYCYSNEGNNSMLIESFNKDSLERISYKIIDSVRGENWNQRGYPKIIDDKIVVLLSDFILVLDSNLNEIEKLPLASYVQEHNESLYQIDISKDMNTLLLNDESGIYLFDNKNNSLIEHLALPRPYYHVYTNDDFGAASFVGPKENIMAVIYGYEWIGATYFYDREAKEGKYFDFSRDNTDHQLCQGDYYCFTDNRLGADFDRSRDHAHVMFNFTDLNYYYIEDGPYACGGFLVWDTAYNGQNHTAIIARTEQVIGNRHVLDKMIYKFDYEIRDFMDKIMFVPGETPSYVVGVLDSGDVIVMIESEDGKEFWMHKF